MSCHAGSAAQARRTAKGGAPSVLCRVPGVAPETSSVRTQTVHEFYTVMRMQPSCLYRLRSLAVTCCGAADCCIHPPLPVDPVPMDDEEEQELLPGDEVSRL